jgi:hypothetical protein
VCDGSAECAGIGTVELYYDSIEDMRSVWGSGHDDTMREDEANFCAPDFRVFCIVEEIEIGRAAD